MIRVTYATAAVELGPDVEEVVDGRVVENYEPAHLASAVNAACRAMRLDVPQFSALLRADAAPREVELGDLTEPVTFGAMVLDDDGHRWVRHVGYGEVFAPWRCETGVAANWNYVRAVKVLR